MIREEIVNETVAQYNECLRPQNLQPHEVAIGNNKDVQRMKYENVLMNPNKIFYVSHLSPVTEVYEEEAGRAYYRCTVQDLGIFAEEIQAIAARCPLLQNLHPTIDRMDNCALVAEWQVRVPMAEAIIQDALNWLAANAAVMVERDFLQDVVLGKKDMNLTNEERFEVAKKFVNLIIDEGLDQNTGVFRTVRNIVENGDADVLNGMWPVKKRVQPGGFVIQGNPPGQYYLDELVQLADHPPLPKPVKPKPLPNPVDWAQVVANQDQQLLMERARQLMAQVRAGGPR